MSDTADLQRQVQDLQAENERLRGSAEVGRSRGPVWRSVASAVVLVAASILVPVSVVSTWARVQLVDESAFIDTLGPLAGDPAVQQLVSDEAVAAIDERVDFSSITSSAVDGLVELGIPPRAEDALRLLEGPAAAGLANLSDSTVRDVVRSPGFADIWAETLRAAHRTLTTAATSDGGGIVVQQGDELGVQVGAIVDRVKARLVSQDVGIAALIPQVDRVVVIGDGTTLATVRTAYNVADTVGWWLPLLTLALFGGGILLARRRSTAVLGSGIGIALGGGVLLVGFAVGRAVSRTIAAQSGLDADGVQAIYDQAVAAMTDTATAVCLAGAALAIIGFFAGSSRAARRLRRLAGDGNAAARRTLRAAGIDTGPIGRALARYRTPIRVLLVLLAAGLLLALRPLTVERVGLIVILTVTVA